MPSDLPAVLFLHENRVTAVLFGHETASLRILNPLRTVLVVIAQPRDECCAVNRWIEPGLPDFLGEYLVHREIEKVVSEFPTLVLARYREAAGPPPANSG